MPRSSNKMGVNANSLPVKEMSLVDFHDKDWFSDRDSSSFWFRAYSCSGIPWKYFYRVTKKGTRNFSYGAPINIYYIIIDVAPKFYPVLSSL